MKFVLKTIIMAIAIYIVQVGALWGLLEGYTYFKGDTLKTLMWDIRDVHWNIG